MKATDEEAVRRLRGRKIREEKPFAVMFPESKRSRAIVMDGREEELLKSPARPIVLLWKRRDSAGLAIAEASLPKNSRLGVFLPYTPLHFLLFDGSPVPSPGYDQRQPKR